MGLSNRLKERREQLGLTQSEVATLLGITPGRLEIMKTVSAPQKQMFFLKFSML